MFAKGYKKLYNFYMAKIRRLNCFDFRKLKKLISYLCNDENDKLAKNLLEEPIGFFNAMLPLKLKFKSESFILLEDKEILGLITVIKTPGNPYKINITRLIFKENRYDIGQDLVNYIIKKYGNRGAKSFLVTIDECHDELFNLFINGCGFRQCACESLWKIDYPQPQKTNLRWRYAQNSDAKKIAQMYNNELVNIYKPSLLRTAQEFQEPFFGGFYDYYKTRYVIEENKQILGYFSITTEDNLNYILDVTTNNGYDFDYDEIINTMLCEIAAKKRAFYPIIKHKKYIKNSDKFEQYLKEKKYNLIQTKQILVKDFYKPVQESWHVFLLNDFNLSCSSGE